MKIVTPPTAKKEPKELDIHGDKRIDNYYWLNNRENPAVLEYLQQENTYYEKATAHTKGLQENLFEEMKARIKEDDESAPFFYNGYYYITRYETGKEYPVFTRRKGKMEAREEVLFDCNLMAEGHAYFHLTGINISPDNRLAAFGVDTVSRRNYTLQVKNLETGEIYPTKIERTTGSSVWANDNKTLFYTRKDPKTLRSDTIYRHTLDTNPEKDVIVFHENDDTFSTYIFKTKSKKYLVIGSSSTLTSEYQILEADTPKAPFRVFSPRERGVEYGIAHFEDSFYILTNKDGATNFKLMKTPEGKTTSDNWEDMVPHRNEILLEDFDIFKNYLVISERINGLTTIHVRSWDGSIAYSLPFDNETYTAYTVQNIEFDTDILRFGYNSLTHPAAIIDFDMKTKTQKVVKEQEVLDEGFDKDNYISERIWAVANDGTKIPVSLVYRKGIKKDGSNPLLQYGYGSYGATIDPYFSTVRLSLLDRGFVFAIAHIRGGEYLGRHWYESGKLLQKRNTFTDFIAVSEHLIAEGYTSPNHLYASGGSAGGLLIGAVINMAPQLYKGVIASVPFVDVVTTMLDDSIPLTTGEYDEWGNPNDPEFYSYMKSYSPYDNVKTQEYPNILITTGLHDSQVQYWEPAKWVAKLREYKTDKNKLLLKTDMETGHGGASGRFETLREVAVDYAFLLDLEGITG